MHLPSDSRQNEWFEMCLCVFMCLSTCVDLKWSSCVLRWIREAKLFQVVKFRLSAFNKFCYYSQLLEILEKNCGHCSGELVEAFEQCHFFCKLRKVEYIWFIDYLITNLRFAGTSFHIPIYMIGAFHRTWFSRTVFLYHVSL